MLQLKCKIFLLIKYKYLLSQRIQVCCSIFILLIIFHIQFKKVIKKNILFVCLTDYISNIINELNI